MDLRVNEVNLNLTVNEATSLCKILGALSPSAVKELSGVGYKCGYKEAEVGSYISEKLADFLINLKDGYMNAFGDKEEKK